MKKYEGELYSGLRLIFNGDTIKWYNRKGRVVESMKPGKYKIERLTKDYIYLLSDRSNASVKHQIPHREIENNIFCLEFADLTNVIGLAFNCRQRWYINDEELIRKAKAYNKKLCMFS